MTILVTGATGFVGRHLCAALAAHGHRLRIPVRSPLASDDQMNVLGETIVVGDLLADTDWSESLVGVSTVVHLASRVHVMNESDPSTETLYQSTNVRGTRCLADAAVAAGVKRFIFVSSAKAAGERGFLSEASIPAPLDAYGRSKLAAELELHEVAKRTGMAVTVVRPPLVYGPHVRANFQRLIRVVDCRLPLPLAAVRNQRSLIYVGNLVSAIQCAVEVDRPASGDFFVSDGTPLSTPDLVRAIASAMQKKSNLWSCPLPLLKFAAAIARKQAELDRLTESLVVDSSAFGDAFCWTPPFTTQDGLRATIDWYREQS